MNSFTISQLQRITGINVHSIRAWEKRYDALQPERTKGNTRYYNGHQLRRLLNIASLMDSDYKISELCSLSDSALHALMNQKLEQHAPLNNDELLVAQLLAAALEFNESLFNKVYQRAIAQHGIAGTYLTVIYPALERLGLMWSADQMAPAQEHFMSNLIRQKLTTAIDSLPVHHQSKKHWLLFLPENEFHESGLLMANYLVRKAGQRCTYLGANVPFDSLTSTVEQLSPSTLLFFLVARDDEQHDQELVRLMAKTFPQQKIYVAADATRLARISPDKNIIPVSTVHQLAEALQ